MRERRNLHIPRNTLIIMFIALLVWGFTAFKEIEGKFFPVVTDFIILDARVVDGSVKLSGTMIKTRECEFLSVVAYSNGVLLNLEFTETREIVTRISGEQFWGWWVITPATQSLTMYARHQCIAGLVVTKLFEGAVIPAIWDSRDPTNIEE